MAAAAKTAAIVRSNRWGSEDQRNIMAWKKEILLQMQRTMGRGASQSDGEFCEEHPCDTGHRCLIN
jgi:hypothetical protein